MFFDLHRFLHLKMNFFLNNNLYGTTVMLPPLVGAPYVLTDLTEEEPVQKLEHLKHALELPEMIIVETRFITQQSATRPLSGIHTVDTSFKDQSQKTKTVAISPKTFLPKWANTQTKITYADTAVSATSTQVDADTLTDAPNPRRDRAQQTDVAEISKATVSIQCNLEQELDDALFEKLTAQVDKVDVSATETETIEYKFLEFVQTNSYAHSNGKVECLRCGEVKINNHNMKSHMAMHWGPTALCPSCGIVFENSSLLRRHRCEIQCKRKSDTKKRSILRCPHYRCRVTAISPLELFDHINEHMAERFYHCYGCRQKFNTAGELRHHMSLRLQCLEMAKRQCRPYKELNTKADTTYRARVLTIYSAKRQRVIVKSFLSTRSKSNRVCQICLQRCSNSFKFEKHIKRCLKTFRFRLERKLMQMAALQSTDVVKRY